MRRTVWMLLGFLRDLTKGSYLFILEICTRLFYIDREYPSSISLRAKLDIIPRHAGEERHNLSLGKRACIQEWSVINTCHGDVILEQGARVGIGSIVIGPVRFGKDSACSQNCFISGESHLYEDVNVNFHYQGFKIEEVVINDNVWIGSNCVILPGVVIGKNSIVGAGSVVTKSIPPFSVAVGNPARVIIQYDAEVGRWQRFE